MKGSLSVSPQVTAPDLAVWESQELWPIAADLASYVPPPSGGGG